MHSFGHKSDRPAYSQHILIDLNMTFMSDFNVIQVQNRDYIQYFISKIE